LTNSQETSFFWSFWTFLAGQQSEQTKKLKNSALNMFHGGARARRAGILFEKIKISGDSGI
jgi:hypothetical protein